MRELRGVDVAMVFQEPSTALNPVYTGRLADRRGPARARQVQPQGGQGQGDRYSRRKVGIPDPENRVDYYPHQFSGGQKQRVVIAMALVLDPGLIVADEPTTALDVTVQAEILDLLRRCRDEFGTAIVLITHNMGVVADLADRVAVMYNGKVVRGRPTCATFFGLPAASVHPAAVARRGAAARDGTSRARRAGAGRRPWRTTRTGRRAKNLTIEYPGRLGRGGFRAVDGVSFEHPPGRGARPGGRERVGQDHDRPRHRRPHQVTGGSLTVLGHEMLGIRERSFKPVRSDIGFVFQDPASSFNPLL